MEQPAVGHHDVDGAVPCDPADHGSVQMSGAGDDGSSPSHDEGYSWSNR